MEDQKHIDKMQSHQYEDIYKTDDVPFKDLSEGVIRHLIIYGIGLFFVLLILSFIVKIPREVNLSFELKGGLNESIFQYPETIYVQNFYKQAGDPVSKGDTLVEITSHKIVGYIEEYETWNQQLVLFNSNKNKANTKTLLLLQKQISGIKKDIEKAKAERSLAESAMNKETTNRELQLQNTINQHKRNESLHTNEVISDLEYESSQRKVQIAEQELISEKETYLFKIAEIDSKLQKLINEKNELEVELEKQTAIFDFDLASIHNKMTLAKTKVRLNYGPFEFTNSSILLISPADGKINLRSENEHEVPAGDILLRIQTDSLNYYAYAEAGAKDIGHIKSTTKAVLKLKSFPHYYYGTLKAEVVSISPSPTEDGLFPVKLKITETGKLNTKITKGMTGTASFVIEERPVIDFVFRSFLKAVTIEED